MIPNNLEYESGDKDTALDEELITLYHGTTIENARNLEKNGWWFKQLTKNLSKSIHLSFLI